MDQESRVTGDACCGSQFHWHRFREPRMVVALTFFALFVALITVGEALTHGWWVMAAGWASWVVAMVLLVTRRGKR